MCPLRIILIFLSASVAGFMAWKAFSSKEDKDNLLYDTSEDIKEKDVSNGEDSDSASPKSSLLRVASKKVAFGFWVLVDMASGQYLWRNLVSNNHKNVKAQ